MYGHHNISYSKGVLSPAEIVHVSFGLAANICCFVDVTRLTWTYIQYLLTLLKIGRYAVYR